MFERRLMRPMRGTLDEPVAVTPQGGRFLDASLRTPRSSSDPGRRSAPGQAWGHPPRATAVTCR